VLVVNPGSVGMPAYRDARPPVPHVIEVGIPHARYALLERTASGWAADLRAARGRARHSHRSGAVPATRTNRALKSGSASR
jgi:hypothetical protein